MCLAAFKPGEALSDWARRFGGTYISECPGGFAAVRGTESCFVFVADTAQGRVVNYHLYRNVKPEWTLLLDNRDVIFDGWFRGGSTGSVNVLPRPAWAANA